MEDGDKLTDKLYSSEGVQSVSAPKKSVSWTASEYITHEKTFSWYVAYLAATTAITVFIYFVLDDFMAAIVVLLVSLSLGFLSTRTPASKEYNLSKNGLKINEKQYNLEDFKSFSIVEEGAIDSVWLKPLGRISPFLILYFSPEDEDKIINTLNYFLPHEPRELDRIDRLVKRLRF